MASERRIQNRAAAKLLRVDKKIKKLKHIQKRGRTQARAAFRKINKAEAKRDRFEARLAQAEADLAEARLARDRVLRVHPDPLGRQISDHPGLRKRVNKLEARANRIERKFDRLKKKARRIRKRNTRSVRHTSGLHEKIRKKKERRERYEDILGASIGRMVDLAQARASTAGSGPASTGFRRPARGYISQGYGCQRRKGGRCVSFHDGIDIAAARGTKVRAAATGYVAYVGWNPWDEGKRAFIVVIGHAGGYETIYGHLLPRRLVKAGKLVRRGQVIGRMGNTGTSTGPHVHWEVSRGFRTLDPRSVGR